MLDPSTPDVAQTPKQWFAARRERVGTHSADCWKYHPDCAYWQGRRDEAEEHNDRA